jgi:hypothetical protein
MEAFTFQCSICGDPSTKLCVYCTKDACNNHLCERCRMCSDCCLCDLPSNAPETSRAAGADDLSPVLESHSERPGSSNSPSHNGSLAY